MICCDTEAIVLRKYYFDDFGIISVVFSKGFGKHTVVSKNLSRHERYGGILDILSYNEISFLENIYSNTNNLLRVDIIDKFANIYTDLNKIFSCLKIIEIIDKCLPEKEKHENIFCLLLELINRINENNINDYAQNIIVFYIYLLKEMGFLLSFSECVCCGNRKKSFEKVSFMHGGILCDSCGDGNNDNVFISKDIYFYLKKIVNFDYSILNKIKLNLSQIRKIQFFFEDYFEYIIGKGLKSVEVEKEVFGKKLLFL